MDFFFCTLNGIHCFPELYRGGTTLIQSQQLLRNYWSSWLSFKKRQGDRLAPGILGKAFLTASKWNLRLCILCFQKLNNTTFASLRWVNLPPQLVNFGSCHQPRKVSFPASGRRYPLGVGRVWHSPRVWPHFRSPERSYLEVLWKQTVSTSYFWCVAHSRYSVKIFEYVTCL